uniref:Protein RIK n=1 Tax=Anthurium amnicola TaxID=1678845 RepID=A0A1D1ZCX2_9ARAE
MWKLDLVFQNLRQGSESVKPGVSSDNLPVRDAASIPPPKKLVELQANGMLPPFQESMLPPPPQKNMPLPPPLKSMPPLPPTFTSTKLPVEDEHENGSLKAPSTERVSDTLMKLMEYGDDDEDTDGNSEECSTSNLIPKATAKPFWAV